MRKIISVFSALAICLCLVCFTGCKQDAGKSETEPKFIYYGYDDGTGECIWFAYIDGVCSDSYDPDVYDDYYAIDTECTKLVDYQLYMDRAECSLDKNGTIYIYEYEGEHWCRAEEVSMPGVTLADTVKGYVYTCGDSSNPWYFFDFVYNGNRYFLYDDSDISLEGIDEYTGTFIRKDYSEYFVKGPIPLYNPTPGQYFGEKYWDAECMLKLPEGDLCICVMEGQP